MLQVTVCFYAYIVGPCVNVRYTHVPIHICNKIYPPLIPYIYITTQQQINKQQLIPEMQTCNDHYMFVFVSLVNAFMQSGHSLHGHLHYSYKPNMYCSYMPLHQGISSS